ncbi:RING-H2 finger protein ATL67-like [Telopea speciosissima]|uniref:RING-H2 finger protein ATL67-like n=1 Tax=Telopea speciosissima TaxID=54955 RepID=UPI001CC5583D|nr:RING-H2 finger protein ATL67-like [Telopea speciosissima]
MSSSVSTASTGNGGGGGSSGYFHRNFTSFGLGYAIAIALGFLVFLSTVLLASYVCFRAHSRTRARSRSPNNPESADTSNADGVILPRIIFVAEDDDGSRDEESVVGLDQTVINSYPKFPFSKSRDCGSGDSMCSICLCDYKDGEMLRMMPDCRHFFHLYCIDAWLRLNASCPVCRNSPLPTPLSTPLSELVPLSQYPWDRRR